MKSLNSITKSIVGAIIFVLIVIWIVNRLSVARVNTATEFLDNYKNCIIVRKDKSTNDYIPVSYTHPTLPTILRV